MLYWVPLGLILLSQDSLLKLLGQQEAVVESTQHYLSCMIPAAFVYGLNDLQNKFMIQMNKQNLILATQSFALLLHIFLNHILLNILHLELQGCALATFATYAFIYLVNRAKMQ